MFSGVIGHPGGGLQMYFLFSGRKLWQKAWMKSPDFGILFI